jgi:hypothetical protein
MKNLRLIRSLVIIFLFGAVVYITTQNHKVSTPISDTSKIPQSQEEYENKVVSDCLVEQKEYEKQYNQKIDQCKKPDCIMVSPDSKDFIPSCVHTSILNDEMSEELSIRGFAEQTQYSVYVKQSGSLSDSEVISQLTKGLTTLNTGNYETNLGLQMSADIREYQIRKLKDPAINELQDSVLTKFGPCWGIPEGQCKE